MNANNPCPCHSGLAYQKCCRVYHEGASAPDPLALMRSRYSAYALGRSDYIMATTHPNSPHYEKDTAAWQAEIEHFTHSTRFIGLKILSSEAATVSFHALLKAGKEDVSFREKSLFMQHEGRWKYVTGVQY